uniref:Arabinogalactan endo-beta-1,4-galactanase n=1 Tax=uncultured bacterium Lq_007_G03 TaxID=1489288 RepID=A0A0B4N1T7_9BACT|nr:putative arabinogalactan endo-1,4-beta-galactosidase [uncultured bacterium Lq_007_G03]
MMMKRLNILLCLLVVACGGALAQGTFWLGADISGTTALEAHGGQLYNSSGEPRENTQLMNELGLNAVRLRVWVNPKDGFCRPDDVLLMASRAKALGMEVMIDFHYSDWWADPGQQNIPAAWKELSYDEMRQALAEHTRSTLLLLKTNGINVRWVQVGNETTNGFLWPMGRAQENMAQYAGLTQAGYEAVKQVFPEAQVIIHLDQARDAKRYDFIFDGLKANGAKWDIIGMSVYPYWDQREKAEKNDAGTLKHALKNMKRLVKKYQTPVMVVETGYEAARPEEGRRFMEKLISACQEMDGRCLGVFYWAPELEHHYPLGAFKDGRPTAIMEAFRHR